MSEDVECLRRLYDAYRDAGVEAVLDHLSPDIVASDRESVPDRATYHGIQGMRELFAATSQAFGEVTLEPEEFLPLNDRIVVSLRQSGRGRASGARITSPIAHVWTMRDGRPVRLKVYRDKRKALEALGVDPETAGEPA